MNLEKTEGIRRRGEIGPWNPRIIGKRAELFAERGGAGHHAEVRNTLAQGDQAQRAEQGVGLGVLKEFRHDTGRKDAADAVPDNEHFLPRVPPLFRKDVLRNFRGALVQLRRPACPPSHHKDAGAQQPGDADFLRETDTQRSEREAEDQNQAAREQGASAGFPDADPQKAENPERRE